MKKFFSEFKQFVARGDVIQLAVGVILGSAINSVAKSLASDIFMPIILLFTGKININSLSIKIPNEVTKETLIIPYGNFLQTLLDFFVTAFCIFIMIKLVKKISNFSLNKVKTVVKEIGKDGKISEVIKSVSGDEDEEEVEDSIKVTEANSEELKKTEALLVEIRDLLKAQNKAANVSDTENGLDSEK